MCRALRVLRSALCVLATPLAAQNAQQWRDSAERLAVRVRALRDSMLQGDSTVREVARRGDLVIGASETTRGAAAEALEQFVALRRRWFGDAAPSSDGFRIVLRSEEPHSRFMPGLEWATVVLAGLPDTGSSARTERHVIRGELAAGLIDLYGEMMWGSAGPAMQKWLQQPPPLFMSDKERRDVAMYALVTGTGKAQRACVAGDLDACGYAVWLRESRDPSLGGGYPAFVRADLLLTALEVGGPGAWRRLTAAADSSVEQALAAAAGLPADSLLARWRGQLLAMRPTQTPLASGGVLLGVAWVALLLLGTAGIAKWV